MTVPPTDATGAPGRDASPPETVVDEPDSCSPPDPDPPEITIALGVLSMAWRAALPGAEALAERAARAALDGAGFGAGITTGGPVELSLVLADDALLRRLNRDHRGLDRPTNVLSFPGEDEAAAAQAGPRLLGDVVLALETLRREAQDQGKTLADHLSHLVVHGVLHLLGYDHDTAPEAAAMERLEIVVLSGLGIADPYAAVVKGTAS